jgi:tRNA A37 threonylcarbamoyladenosine biosynthesis protein TsaE
MEQQINFTLDQQSAFGKIQNFLKSNGQVFILQGAAGSGKTTLIRAIVSHITKEKKLFAVMAPTGRAAKVLRDKTGLGCTIHRGIYNFDILLVR